MRFLIVLIFFSTISTFSYAGFFDPPIQIEKQLYDRAEIAFRGMVLSETKGNSVIKVYEPLKGNIKEGDILKILIPRDLTTVSLDMFVDKGDTGLYLIEKKKGKLHLITFGHYRAKIKNYHFIDKIRDSLNFTSVGDNYAK